MSKFIDWCHSVGMEETRVVECDLVSMCTLKEAWDHQQKEINSLTEENFQQEQTIRAFMRDLRNIMAQIKATGVGIDTED